MVASRELDAIVAEKVMGWSSTRFMNNVHRVSARHPVWQEFIVVPRYSTDLAAAWQVVDVLLKRNPMQDIHLEHMIGTGWGVSCCYSEEHGGWDGWVYGETAPLAICLAALKSVGFEIPLDTQ
jgi:hypothetical protein